MGKKVLLYSGGMDSWLADKLWKPDVLLHVCIGTPNEKQELDRILKQRPDVVVHHLDIAKFEDPTRNFLLPTRNLFFAAIGGFYGDEVCLAATGSSTHYDKNEKFCNMTSDLLTYLWSESTDRKVRIVIPFRGVSKPEMLRRYVAEGGDPKKCWDETFSCYSPKEDGTPCWQCTSCQKKIKAFAENGYDFLH